MRVVKSVIPGVTTAVVSLVAWIVANIVFALMRFEIVARSGAGGLGAVSGAIPELGGLIAMAVGFIGGFYWMWRRSARGLVR